MAYISKDAPCYFFTSVTNSRLPIFRRDEFKLILCQAIDEARQSGKFSIHAFCIMPDHSHIVTGGELSPSNTLRYINGISARRIVDALKGNPNMNDLCKSLRSTLAASINTQSGSIMQTPTSSLRKE